MKPFLERCIVEVKKNYIKEKGKQVKDESGEDVYEPEQIAIITKSNIEGVTKGMEITPLLRGGVPIKREETKTHLKVILDKEEVYATE